MAVAVTKLQAVIFDVDGTLVDSERDGHRLAFNAAFLDYGLDWHWDEALYGELLEIGGGKERIRHYAQRIGMKFPTQAECDAFVQVVHTAKTRHFRSLLGNKGIPPRPGVVRLLKDLRQAGVRLAIATTSADEAVITLLQTSLGASSAPDWFEVIGAGEVVPTKKPAPDIYLWVLNQLNLEAFSCLAVEDSRTGLRASLSAGLTTVITVNAYTESQDFSGSAAVLSDLGEPDHPFRVLRGNAYHHTHVTPSLMERWLTQSTP